MTNLGVERDGFFDLRGSKTSAPAHAPRVRAIGQGAAISTEGGRELLERQSALIAGNDDIKFVFSEPNLRLFARRSDGAIGRSFLALASEDAFEAGQRFLVRIAS